MKKAYSSPAAVKVGVVGYGGAFNMGRQHLKEMQAAGMTPVAVAEVDPARLEVARQDFADIQTYSSVADLLARSDVDLVTVITPHNTHADLGLQIVSAGRHCVLEKPMAITTAECDAMIDAAKKQGVIVSTYHNRHWDGWIMQAVEVVNSGVLGDIVRVDLRMGSRGQPRNWWRSSRVISGGILYDWGVHLLEYALQIVKGDLTEVSGYAWEGFWAAEPNSPYPAAEMNEDEAQLVARFSSGQRINLTLTQLDAAPERGRIKIVGTRGVHLIDWPDYETTVNLPGGETQVTKGKCPPSQGEKFYQNIAAHLTQGEPLVITGEWARRPIHILDLAVQSARQHRALPAVHR
ncbi:gfo/Idh/MocA family oxidoreductase [Opitutaceae bacterium TAV4]|nr:gfo/Idh/MocA family oxidoreductase [Opitutaceae bacterium TAV4]RRJ99820.1 gfo/Idh/MocA family oxidoreductase [Opitutaceae bacterium TAV3]